MINFLKNKLALVKTLSSKIFSDKRIYIPIVTALVAVLVGFSFHQTSSFEVSGTAQIGKPSGEVSKITGQACEHPNRRPVAVMMASDPVVRPLSGLSQADIVFEMPVTGGGVTRMMAVFQCEDPSEIGSIRSARQDFIPLSAGLGALYTHWGGERDALIILDGGITNNINAMKYEGSTFYRKLGIRPPHNGFTSIEKLLERSADLKYKLENTFEGYPHSEIGAARSIANLVETINLNYPSPYDVVWRYNEKLKVYERFRDGSPEKDGLSNETVSAGVVVVMEATTQTLNEFYNRVSTEGEGRVTIYQGGISTSGIWRKKAELSSKLYFFDNQGKEISFVPGKIWVEIVI